MSLVGTFNVGGDNAGGSTASAPVRSSLYLGGKEDAKSLEKLLAKKIKYILNVTPKKTDLSTGVSNYFQKSRHGFVYLRVPIFDSSTSVVQLEQEYKDQVVNFIRKGLFHGNVLVHCHHGVSRSTTCVVLYLMR
jgi:protein-tyrosine phosphatase